MTHVWLTAVFSKLSLLSQESYHYKCLSLAVSSRTPMDSYVMTCTSLFSSVKIYLKPILTNETNFSDTISVLNVVSTTVLTHTTLIGRLCKQAQTAISSKSWLQHSFIKIWIGIWFWQDKWGWLHRDRCCEIKSFPPPGSNLPALLNSPLNGRFSFHLMFLLC